MATLARSPSRYGSKLRLKGFPISDMFGQEAAAVVSNEAAGLPEARKRRSFASLPMPGVRGAMARAEDHGYQPAPRRFLGSVHMTQQVAWLGAEVSWEVATGGTGLRVEGGTLEEGEVPAVTGTHGSLRLVFPAAGPPLRCHALAYVLTVETAAAAVRVDVAAREAGEWRAAAAFELPGAGTYLGLLALDKRPRTIDAVRVSLADATRIAIYDLALLTFG
jgi:hypothetical protein